MKAAYSRPRDMKDDRFLFSVILSLALFGLLATGCRSGAGDSADPLDEPRKIAVEEYEEKVYASWLGQIIGNIYGLPHENAYIEQPGPETFPYGYQRNLEALKVHDGAFSDDDTDFEYLYLLQMEKHGPEPTYKALAEAWMHHVRDRVWLANRAALGLMHYGFEPPVTGMKAHNPHWFQIDPQLVNEIWAVTAPGMIAYAVDKSAWAARITDDDWGIEPTMFYGAMYAAAFFESDVYELVEIGLRAMPEGSRFSRTVEEMKSLYAKYPTDWKSARQEMAEMYYHNEPIDTRTIWNANLNGAAGILALLYGEGDFQKTLDLSCAMGFDADNQAATMSGLLGLAQGMKGLPQDLLFPLPELGWQEPFNDRYKNVTRHDMPDAGLKDMARRMARQGEAIILEHGGQKVSEQGIDYYLINPAADFSIPLEFPGAPDPYVEVGQDIEYSFFVSGSTPDVTWSVVRGALPVGLRLDRGHLSGRTDVPGVFPLTLEVRRGAETAEGEFQIVVRPRNAAPQAASILSSVRETDTATRDSLWLTVGRSLYATQVEVIRDGKRLGNGTVFYSITPDPAPKQDYYGYEWTTEQDLGLLGLHLGSMEEQGGWFTSLDVEFRDAGGDWKSVDDLVVSPGLVSGAEPFNKPHFVEYLLAFKPVRTKAIRVVGEAGSARHWRNQPTPFTSITELSAHGALPGYEELRDPS